MQIIILLSGQSQRFLQAGYSLPKALLEIDGKPMIEHVVHLFPEKSRFLFVCRQDHYKETPLPSLLKKIAPTAEIVQIPPHHKGPVFSLQYVLELLSPQEEVIVNYCDFGTYWDYSDFLAHTRNRNASGAIVVYRGFHPHLPGTTNYAFIRHHQQYFVAVQEKKPFTTDPMSEFISNGTYYFQKGAFLKHYTPLLLESNLSVEGEFYVSLLYQLMQKDYPLISLYEIQHMLQWGTPKEMQQYQAWSHFFAQRSSSFSKEVPPIPNALDLDSPYFEATKLYWMSFFHKCFWHPYSLFSDPQLDPLKAQQLDLQFRRFSQEYG